MNWMTEDLEVLDLHIHHLIVSKPMAGTTLHVFVLRCCLLFKNMEMFKKNDAKCNEIC